MPEWIIRYHEIAFYQEELVKMIRSKKDFTLISTQADSFFEKVFLLLDTLSDERDINGISEQPVPTEIEINRIDWMREIYDRALDLQKKINWLLIGENGWPTAMAGTKQRICLADQPTENVMMLSHIVIESKDQLAIITELGELVKDIKTLVK